MSNAVGLVLVAIGVIGLVWGGITYTTREKVVDLGPIEATREKRHDLPLPPLVGGVALLAGVVLLVTTKKSA